jgi:pimeloyl-ACP methyl ester carboxylesterase
MTTFVLVHGAFHGPWCWTTVGAYLTSMGHTPVAVDLPSDDPAAAWQDHVAAVIQATPVDGDVVLVGHSRAGRLLPLVTERGNFRHVIYVGASLPPTEDRRHRRCDALPMVLGGGEPLRTDEQGRSVCPPSRAAALYYPDCSPEVRDWATVRLRPQCEIDFPFAKCWPATPASYVACREDRAVNPQWMEAAAIEILGHPPRWLDGGHAPFLSRPAELAALVSTIAAEIR